MLKKFKILFVVLVLIIMALAFNFYFVLRQNGWNVFDFKPTFKLLNQFSVSSGNYFSFEKEFFSQLNGEKISAETKDLPVLAVIIENSESARPQRGLNDAEIVYETLAEGGITRFMALFQTKKPLVLGPIRSARKYFAEISREYNAWITHVGGSEDGLAFISKNNVNDVDEYAYPDLFWRDPTWLKKRSLEHTMLSSADKLHSVITDTFYENFKPWDFNADPKYSFDPLTANSVTIDFSFLAFKVRWDYDTEKNLYKRFNGGVEHLDDLSEQQLTTKNVLVQFVDIFSALNYKTQEYSAVDLDLIGEGRGVFFRDGKIFPVIWKKILAGERTEFFYEDLKPLEFAPGKIWVELAEEEMASW